MKRVEVLANIAVILTSILLCSVLVKKYYMDKSKAVATTLANSSAGNGPSKRTVQPGSKVSLEGIDWSQANHTLVLALSTTCHFCTESAPLYRQIEQQRVNDLKIVSVFPQSVADAKAYQERLGLSFQVVQSPLKSLGVSGTPTLILINRDGVVLDSWTGKLPDEEGAKLLQRLGGATNE